MSGEYLLILRWLELYPSYFHYYTFLLRKCCFEQSASTTVSLGSLLEWKNPRKLEEFWELMCPLLTILFSSWLQQEKEVFNSKYCAWIFPLGYLMALNLVESRSEERGLYWWLVHCIVDKTHFQMLAWETSYLR